MALTNKELRDLGLQHRVYIPTSKNKSQILEILRDAGIQIPSVSAFRGSPSGRSPAKSPSPRQSPAKSPQRSPVKSLNSYTVKELRAIAIARGIYIPSKRLKSEIVEILSIESKNPESGVVNDEEKKSPQSSPRSSPSRSLPKGSCSFTLSNGLSTTPFEDYNQLLTQRLDGPTLAKCLDYLGLKKNARVGKGKYGEVFLANYKGEECVYKIVGLTKGMGFEAFLWECVISERASQIGIGPRIIYRNVCYSKGVPTFGIIIMAKCVAVKNTEWFTEKELGDIRMLINHMNKNGILHRDLSPNNIMRNGVGGLVIIDFGLSFVYNEPIPKELKDFDHNIFLNNYKWYADEYKLPGKQLKGSELDVACVKYFPQEMIDTMHIGKLGLFMNNISKKASDQKLGITLDRQINARKKTKVN